MKSEYFIQSTMLSTNIGGGGRSTASLVTNIFTDGPSSPTSQGSPSSFLLNSRPGGANKLPKKRKLQVTMKLLEDLSNREKEFNAKLKSSINGKNG